MKIKRDDIVKIVSPKFPPKERYRSSQGRVLEVLPDRNQVIVEGMNLVWKHVKPRQDAPKGGRIQREAPIHVSKVRLICQECNKPTRVKVGWIENPEVPKKRRKVRLCKKCGKPVRPQE